MGDVALIGGPLADFFKILAPQRIGTNKNPVCRKIEDKFLDCLEAYGIRRVKINCAELLYDVTECSTSATQRLRMKAIQEERMKKYREGKLSKPFEEHPPLDSYLSL